MVELTFVVESGESRRRLDNGVSVVDLLTDSSTPCLVYSYRNHGHPIAANSGHGHIIRDYVFEVRKGYTIDAREKNLTEETTGSFPSKGELTRLQRFCELEYDGEFWDLVSLFLDRGYKISPTKKQQSYWHPHRAKQNNTLSSKMPGRIRKKIS